MTQEHEMPDIPDMTHRINEHDCAPVFVPYGGNIHHAFDLDTFRLLQRLESEQGVVVISMEVDAERVKAKMDKILGDITEFIVMDSCPRELFDESVQPRTPRSNLPWYRKYEGGHKRQY